MKKLLIALSMATSAASAAEQRYLLGTDVVQNQKPSIVRKADGVIVVTRPNVKYTLTPTKETRYGAFGEPVVFLEDILSPKELARNK